MADREEAKEVLKAAGSTADLKGLLDAIETAGKEEAFDLIAGTDPIPSNMGDLRALRLRRICEIVKRELTIREIEIVFRIGTSAAKVVDGKMRATYPQQMKSIRVAREAAMREGAKVTLEGSGEEQRFKIRFSQPSLADFARELIEEVGFGNSFEQPDERHLILDFRVELPGGKQGNLLTEVLGLTEPKP
jgi:hypothetical protein